ncbi:hemolysin XhlA family protein [Clostridium swellfunianum]|uniref:hemolysin XhlA family protein n=1 Tax=Clostridium swellfunianum TaxID=1367462 RepID=UPI002030C40A|nr:hemolysin XhlA family protein [Clostridium swellfunianum]MCM0648621.1 hemolysin XhlA family protein [Clostridium swellfunianum]
MDDRELMQDVRDRLIRIEGKIETTYEKYSILEKRVTKLEENNTWLSRAVIGQLIAAIIAFFIIKK